MAIGVSSFGYRWAVQLKRLDILGLLEQAKNAGAEVVQICENLPLEKLQDQTLNNLSKAARKLGLILEVGIKGSEDEHIRHHLDIAKKLNASLLRVVLTEEGKVPTFDELVSTFRSLAPVLHDLGITMGIENHFTLNPKELADLIGKIGDPSLGICLDPMNSISMLIGPHETVTTLAPLAVSVHVKDARARRVNTGFYVEGCPLGEGLVDIPGMVKAVQTSGRSPNLLVEAWMDRLESGEETLAQEERWIREGISYLRSLHRKA
jgi:sugar phosphate isomerase/epimerase